MSAIERELCLVLDTKQKKGEDRQKFLARLIERGYDISEKQWNKLSKEAQAWFNEASKAQENKQQIPEPPDAGADQKVNGKADETGEKSDASEHAESKENEVATKKTAKKDQVKKDEPKKAEKVEKSEKKSATRTSAGSGSMQRMLRELVVRNPQVDIDTLMDKLAKAGHKPSRLAVASIRSNARAIIQIMINEGKAKNIEL